MRIWAQGGAALLAAGLACVVSWSLLSVALPRPVTRPKPGPVLETVTPAQLAAMNVRLDATLQPVQLPDWLSRLGVRLPSGVLPASDAEAAVRSAGGVRTVTERVLAYATVTGTNARAHGPIIVSRLVWAVVGTRALAGSVGGFLRVLWLVDARLGRQLTEVTVVPAAPAGAAAGPGP